ncbi:MAG: hypothetical protein QGH37_11695 [Candidatus Poribacteria bacterium]|nr:hypothetical protein [Candidatus Poribacteria bacterium]
MMSSMIETDIAFEIHAVGTSVPTLYAIGSATCEASKNILDEARTFSVGFFQLLFGKPPSGALRQVCSAIIYAFVFILRLNCRSKWNLLA